LGVRIRVNNAIPLASGLGAAATFWVAGIIGANNLLGHSISRREILRLSAQISPQPSNAIGALLGGLTSSLVSNDEVIYRSLPVAALTLILIVPDIKNYPESVPAPDTVPFADARYNLDRLPLLLHGLQSGDLSLISQTLDDRLISPTIRARIPGINHVIESARLAGALAVTTAGAGPALIVIAPHDHHAVADAVVAAFGNTHVEARSWILPVDTQGVVISAMQSG
jgi:homoserine kinase